MADRTVSLECRQWLAPVRTSFMGCRVILAAVALFSGVADKFWLFAVFPWVALVCWLRTSALGCRAFLADGCRFAHVCWVADIVWLLRTNGLGCSHTMACVRNISLVCKRTMAAGNAYSTWVASNIWLLVRTGLVGCINLMADRIGILGCRHGLAVSQMLSGLHGRGGYRIALFLWVADDFGLRRTPSLGYRIPMAVRTIFMGCSLDMAVRTHSVGCRFSLAAFAVLLWIPDLFWLRSHFSSGLQIRCGCSHCFSGLQTVAGCGSQAIEGVHRFCGCVRGLSMGCTCIAG